jgi:hypothetical protein
MCACCQIEPKIHVKYSLHSSLVERQLSIRGGHVYKSRQIQYLNLGFLHHKKTMQACTWYLLTGFSGAFTISGAFIKIKSRKI